MSQPFLNIKFELYFFGYIRSGTNFGGIPLLYGKCPECVVAVDAAVYQSAVVLRSVALSAFSAAVGVIAVVDVAVALL